MRAYQNVAMYCVRPEAERRKHMKEHKKRMKEIKPFLTKNDTHFAPTQSPRSQDSSKISALRYGTDAYIAKNNLILAKRIFEIMEGPGIISDLMEADTNTHHPGTINFPQRLAEAKRIHNENLIIASRLDAIQPTYYDKSTVTAVRKGSPIKTKRPVREKKKRKMTQNRLGQTMSNNATSTSETKPVKSKNVLLEYTKVQRGRMLDVAVIKEPFRDCYAIFGIDIDNGQRYELKLTSEEVSSILEGDILVTTTDNAEVWMALIAKVELNPVESFSKNPHSDAPHSEPKKPTKPSSLNSSKNQKFNPRLANVKDVNSSNNVTTATSVGSSSAVNGTDDDYSLTTGGGEENQNQSNEVLFDDEDSAKGYTLDEYYEDHAPLSPLPSQTGFVTSAPSTKPRTCGSSPRNETSGADIQSEHDVSYATSLTVSYVIETAVKNILMHEHLEKKTEIGDAKTKKSEKSGTPSKLNPYTNTRVSIEARSHSIMYKQVPTQKEKVKKSPEKVLPHRPSSAIPMHEVSQPPDAAKNETSVTSTAKEPQKPKEAPPLGMRRPTNKPRQTIDDPNKKQNLKAQNIRKPSESSVNASRKRSSAVRKFSSFRARQDPMLALKSVSSKMADLVIKTATRKVNDIVEMLNIELPET